MTYRQTEVHLLQEPRQQMQLLWAFTVNAFGINSSGITRNSTNTLKTF
jgi:hypothetical protein